MDKEEDKPKSRLPKVLSIVEVAKQQRKFPVAWKDAAYNMLEFNMESDIVSMSRGLSEQEVLDYWGIQLADLKGDDLLFFNYCFNKGRSEGKKTATDRLFDRMQGKGGVEAVMNYMVRFGDRWETKVEQDSKGITNYTFNTGRKK